MRIVVHGGVDMPTEPPILDALTTAARRGWDRLTATGDPVAAVETAIAALEDDPGFNAGRGSVLNDEGEVEADVGIVDASARRFAALSGLRDVTNPIRAATALLRRAPGPVLLAGPGAQRFVREIGLNRSDLRTAEQVAIWRDVREHGRHGERSLFTGRPAVPSETVGCIVATDDGLVAGSSTGGLVGKHAGRIGDAAVHGAGIYGDPDLAVLCSGQGEVSIELCLAMRAASLAREHGSRHAARWAVSFGVDEKDLAGGVIVYDRRRDELAVAHSTASFPVVTLTGAGAELVEPTAVERVP